MGQALKGGDDGHVHGDLKGLECARETFATSSGRLRRRNRCGWSPHPTPPLPKAKAIREADFALGRDGPMLRMLREQQRV